MTLVRHPISSALGKLVVSVTSARTNCPFLSSPWPHCKRKNETSEYLISLKFVRLFKLFSKPSFPAPSPLWDGKVWLPAFYSLERMSPSVLGSGWHWNLSLQVFMKFTALTATWHCFQVTFVLACFAFSFQTLFQKFALVNIPQISVPFLFALFPRTLQGVNMLQVECVSGRLSH